MLAQTLGNRTKLVPNSHCFCSASSTHLDQKPLLSSSEGLFLYNFLIERGNPLFGREYRESARRRPLLSGYLEMQCMNKGAFKRFPRLRAAYSIRIKKVRRICCRLEAQHDAYPLLVQRRAILLPRRASCSLGLKAAI